MRYRVLMSVEIEASGDQRAYADAVKMKKLLQGPMVKMAVESDGIRLVEDGRPIVHEPIPV